MSRILVIDDDHQIRTTLRQVLELEGHEVIDAPDGKAGMRAFRQQSADLIFFHIWER